jgi:hypothetical protein
VSADKLSFSKAAAVLVEAGIKLQTQSIEIMALVFD